MNKKDFIALADVVREYNQYHPNEPFTACQIGALAGFYMSQTTTKLPVGPPLRLYECKSCGKLMGAAAVRSHKC